MSPLALGMDILLAALLAAALFVGARLNARLAALREGQAGFAHAVGELNAAAARADSALRSLRAASEETHDALLDRIETARSLIGRLEDASSAGEKTLRRADASPPSRLASLLEEVDRTATQGAGIGPPRRRALQDGDQELRPAQRAADRPSARLGERSHRGLFAPEPAGAGGRDLSDAAEGRSERGGESGFPRGEAPDLRRGQEREHTRDPFQGQGRGPGQGTGRDAGRDPGRDFVRNPVGEPPRDLGRDFGGEGERAPASDLGRTIGREAVFERAPGPAPTRTPERPPLRRTLSELLAERERLAPPPALARTAPPRAPRPPVTADDDLFVESAGPGLDADADGLWARRS